ncbi:lipopolysaccharide biosynthesis protein [Neobacillus sp. YIM B02564]|uniref:Lipopolysaccharide biosynthesis protein n=1 Tax=Neobacillus paridis TaxID=2803862 RepID=A0ABS1TX38_9BACI|nr:lipopolysaccharide biosynthesis protein [Neobacillus paridis]MBL4954465.1 lipopolysaccharide biosynthesis protein [Neobacillus paridis]
MVNPETLKGKTIKGVFWSFTDIMANQGVQFIVLMILARQLLPEHFGIIGMITIFISISNSLIDSGFTQALVREQEPTQEDYSTAFYFNLLMGFIMYGILFFSAGFISFFFKEPNLSSIIRILAIVVIINSVTIIQRAILIKKVDFKTQMKINIISGISSGITAIICAGFGLGVWSLVIKTLLMQSVTSFLLWIHNKWKPSIVFNFSSFKRLFGFGSKMMISGIIDTIYTNIYYVIIGKFYSSTQLGYYSNAVKLSDVASQSITSSIQRVTYPVLSTLQNDQEKLKFGYKKIMKVSAFINFPVMAGLAAIAVPLVSLILGEKWIQLVPYFQLLCLAYMLYPFHVINLNILQVKGRSDLFLLLEIIKKIVTTILIALAIFLHLGIIGLIWVAIINSFIALFINSFFSAKEISYSISKQIIDILPHFLISIFMGGIVYILGTLIQANIAIKLIVQIGCGVLLYIAFCWMFRLKELEMVFQLLLRFFQNRKQRLKSGGI